LLIDDQVPVYIAEITPKGLRGGFTTVHQLLICLGVSVTYLLGSFIGWRILALIGMIPCVVQMMGLFVIPESPRWLVRYPSTYYKFNSFYVPNAKSSLSNHYAK
jgi:SP family facilitated glucose transporter-like MFS transporter 8